MITDWKQLLRSTKQAYPLLLDNHPKLAKAQFQLSEAVSSTACLSSKECELIALAVAVTTQCDSCIASHISKAVSAGVTAKEISESLGIAILCNAQTTFFYAQQVVEIFGQFADDNNSSSDASSETDLALQGLINYLRDGTKQNEAITPKLGTLIALAVAVTKQCDISIKKYVAEAKSQGITWQELTTTLGVAIQLNAGATTVYSVKVADAFNMMKGS